MTRSELVEKGIELFNHAVAMTKDESTIYFGNEEMREMNQFGLNLFIAEQKRAADCGICNIEKIKGLMLDREFRFCPYCGRELTEGESV